MHACNGALVAPDRCIIGHDMDISAWIWRWMHYSGRGTGMSRCISTEADCPFLHCYEEVES